MAILPRSDIGYSIEPEELMCNYSGQRQLVQQSGSNVLDNQNPDLPGRNMFFVSTVSSAGSAIFFYLYNFDPAHSNYGSL